MFDPSNNLVRAADAVLRRVFSRYGDLVLGRTLCVTRRSASPVRASTTTAPLDDAEEHGRTASATMLMAAEADDLQPGRREDRGLCNPPRATNDRGLAEALSATPTGGHGVPQSRPTPISAALATSGGYDAQGRSSGTIRRPIAG